MTAALLLVVAGAWLLLPGGGPTRLPGTRATTRRWEGHDLAAIAAGVGAAVLVGGVGGVVIGGTVGLLARFGLSRIGIGDGDRSDLLARDAPAAIDCLAACLSAGAPLWPAMSAVAYAYPGPIQEVLESCVRRHAMGSEPQQTFASLLEQPALANLGRILVRSAESGGSLSNALLGCASRMRQDRAGLLQQRARAVGVKAVGPLGLCFLPAFLLLAVVPIVGSMVQELL